MKVGELRGAIRKTKGNPHINVYPFPGTDKGFRFALQKTPLLEELERVYPGGKAVETGLDFNVETGLLKSVAYDEHMALDAAQKAAAFEGTTVAALDEAAAIADANAAIEEANALAESGYINEAQLVMEQATISIAAADEDLLDDDPLSNPHERHLPPADDDDLLV